MATTAEIVEGALANYTGKGFGGDMGARTPEELFEADRDEFTHHGIKVEDVAAALEELVVNGRAVRAYAFPPTQCVRCSNDPCTCGIGTWR